MIIEWDTTSGDSWKQRVYGLCGLNDQGTLKTKICVVLFVLFCFFSFFFLFDSLKLNINIICK